LSAKFHCFSISFYSNISARKRNYNRIVTIGKELSYVCKRIFGAACRYHIRIGSFGCAMTGSLFFNQLWYWPTPLSKSDNIKPSNALERMAS
jgi:hypothetical protein